MMNPLRELKLNQPGRIELLDSAPRLGADGTVREISAEAILLELRASETEPRFEVGQRVTFKYWDVFGLHRGETQVKHVSRRANRGNVEFTELSVAPPENVELTQKRKFFRVHVSVPVSLSGTHARPDGGSEPLEFRATTLDLTPAGMRVSTPVLLAVGALFEARLLFGAASSDPGETVLAVARVVRSTRRLDERDASPDPRDHANEPPLALAPYSSSVEFLGLSEADQMRISLHLFELQRHVPT